ncbi:DUF2510 domain-containing protein [Mycobacterium sp.]|uniref:DUF2510 domain-containing protein n=1 Tax=Mycobacterium sp. TaxID=1785 RepID=UPI0034298C33
MPSSPGWYDDPDGSQAERYFDGRQWTPQRRRKPVEAHPPPAPNFGALPRAAAGPRPSDPPVGPLRPSESYQAHPAAASGGYQPLPPVRGQFGPRLSNGVKIALAVAAAVVLAVIASIVISAEPWHSQRYKECRAAMEDDGYKGDDLEQATQFCVNVTKP